MSRRPAITAHGRGWRIAFVAALALGQAIGAGLAAFATRDVFSALHANGPLPVAALLTIAVAACAIAGLRVAERAAAERIGCDYATAVREKLFLHTARLPPSVIAQRSRGGLTLRFVGDLSAIRNWVARGVVRLLSAAIILPCSALVLAFLDWRLALAASAPITLGIVALAMLGKPLHAAHGHLRQQRSRLAIGATERLVHGAALRLVGLVSVERKRLADRAQAVTDASTNHARLAGTARALPEAVGGIAAVAILAVAAVDGVAPAVAAGALACLSLTLRPLRFLADVRDRYGAWRVATHKIDQALETPALEQRLRKRAQPDLSQPALVIETTRDADALVVHQGQTVTLDDDEGAASRLLLAVAGIEPEADARIRIFGQTPQDTPTGTMIYIGPVSPIIRGSLKRNLLLGGSKKRRERAILEILAQVGLCGLITRLGGLGARIGEGGQTLSRQDQIRLLAARAILSEAPVVLIDAGGLAVPDALLEDILGRLRAPNRGMLITRTRPVPCLSTGDGRQSGHTDHR